MLTVGLMVPYLSLLNRKPRNAKFKNPKFSRAISNLSSNFIWPPRERYFSVTGRRGP
jgi:hypothetical protein